MRGAIVDYVLDGDGDWIAHLSCGHSQHVRHRPPFQERAWVLEEESRRARLETYLLCPLCDRGELPERMCLVRNSPVWDNETAPSAIRNFHHLAEGTWGVITVGEGQMRFITNGEVVMNVLVDTSSPRAIPPGLDHSVEFTGPVRFSIGYFSVERDESDHLSDGAPTSFASQEVSGDDESDFGGESACFAHLVCPVCGAIPDVDPHVHRIGPPLD